MKDHLSNRRLMKKYPYAEWVTRLRFSDKRPRGAFFRALARGEIIVSGPPLFNGKTLISRGIYPCVLRTQTREDLKSKKRVDP